MKIRSKISWAPLKAVCCCLLKVEASPSILFPDGVSLTSTGGDLASCSPMIYQRSVKVKASPGLLFPNVVPLNCGGRGQSQPPVSF